MAPPLAAWRRLPGDPTAPLDFGRCNPECIAPGAHDRPSTRLKKLWDASAPTRAVVGRPIAPELVDGRRPTRTPAPDLPPKESKRWLGGFSGTIAAPLGGMLALVLAVGRRGERAALDSERSIP